ncbi:MAG: TonB-dependent receptor [Bacteroidota bacterium]
MKSIKLISLLSILFISGFAYGQKGTIRGTVIDDANGEPMFSVTVVIKGSTIGAVTDFDGKFEINIDAGTYDLQASFISYSTISVTGVAVKAGEVTLIDQIRLSEAVEQLAEVVITAEAIRTTEAALQTVKRKSANVLDGISAASFRKIGDSDAASAAKRITGVSIEGGKYVFVRGLGDRYSKTLLNGMDVPGLDPDKNALQIDLFPTNILNNILVAKSFTADLPADFTGGMVDIETKDIPDVKTFDVQLGLGYTPSMHFQDQYLTYDGSSTDFLGFDDGQRDIPFSDSDLVNADGDLRGRVDPPDSPEGLLYASQLRSFDRQLSAMRENSFMDFNFGLSLGNQFDLGKRKLGYSAAMTYRNKTRFYEDAVYGRAGLAGDASVTELEQREFQQGDQGENEVLLGGMFGLSLKGDVAKYRLNFMRLQNGEKRTAIYGFVGSDEGSDFISYQHNLEYTERQLNNLLISGEYFLNDSNWKIDWKISPTISKISEPDIRFTRYEIRGIQPEEVDDVSNIEELTSRPGTELSITTEGGFPERIWRDLEEDNLSSRVDAAKDYKFFERDAKLKFGLRSTLKNRDYAIRRNQIFIDDEIRLTGDPNEIFLEENLWFNGQGNPLGNSGHYFQADYVPRNSNSFESTINNLGVYVSNEFNPTENLKAVVGIRAENYVQRYTGSNQNGDVVLDDEKVVDEFEFYPTVNLIYALNENQNLRLSYSRTTARFSFKEASFAEIFDPVTGRTFIGSLAPIEDGNEVLWDGNIQSTLIDNFDVRWEVFQKRGQLISVSGFYKKFTDAIELVQLSTADNNFQVQNVGDATVIGGEVEIRQSLAILSPALENLTFSGNYSLIHSEVEMSDAEFFTRVDNQREGQTIDRERDFQGQAPFILNLGFAYAGLNNGLEAGIYYNVQGETLTVTGAADKPDVYTVPFHSVNLNINKNFGEDEKIRVGFKVSNLLDDKREKEFQSFQSSDRLFESLSPGRQFSASLRYKIF